MIADDPVLEDVCVVNRQLIKPSPSSSSSDHKDQFLRKRKSSKTVQKDRQ